MHETLITDALLATDLFAPFRAHPERITVHVLEAPSSERPGTVSVHLARFEGLDIRPLTPAAFSGLALEGAISLRNGHVVSGSPDGLFLSFSYALVSSEGGVGPG